MNITGYSIELSKCVKCQKHIETNEIYFSIEHGGILCNTCVEKVNKKLKIHNKICEFLYTLSTEEFLNSTYYDNLATENICDRCIQLLKKYIEYYSPKRFKTTKILESIK